MNNVKKRRNREGTPPVVSVGIVPYGCGGCGMVLNGLPCFGCPFGGFSGREQRGSGGFVVSLLGVVAVLIWGCFVIGTVSRIGDDMPKEFRYRVIGYKRLVGVDWLLSERTQGLHGSLAQPVEHRVEGPGVRGSIPRWPILPKG